MNGIRLAIGVLGLIATLAIAADPAPSLRPFTNSIVPSIPEKCAAPCMIRESSGKCLSTGSETCGLGYACVPRCILRKENGICLTYSADFCGSGATCEARCLNHNGDGTCTTYVGDACSAHL